MNRTELKCAGLGALVTAAAFVVGSEAMALAHPASPPRESPSVTAPSVEPPRAGGSCELEMAANRNLVEQVREYRERAERAVDETQAVPIQADETADVPANEPPPKSEWDLSTDELSDLARMGSVKQRVPCSDRHGWRPTPDALEKLGLAPQDGRVLEEAAAHAYQQSWKTIKDVCSSLPDGQAPESMDRDDCVNAIYLSFTQSDPDGTSAAVRRASEERAGTRAAPWVGDSRLHPVEKVALALAEAQKAYEAELSHALGPEDAHRAAFSEDLCTTYVSWEGTPEDPS